MIKIAVDAMGGDNAPSEIVKGAVEAVSERPDITVCLTGQEDIIKKELGGVFMAILLYVSGKFKISWLKEWNLTIAILVAMVITALV